MMKKALYGAILVLSVTVLGSGSLQAQANQTDWQLFSKALVKAAKHDNHGVRLGAIQQIAIYGSHLDVDDAVFDVVGVYRNSKNQNERILALSALGKMRNAWAMDFLSRSVPFEKNDRVRQITIDVVNQYRTGPNNPESARALAIWEAQQTPPSRAEIDALLAAD
jgi:hypothetical protein